MLLLASLRCAGGASLGDRQLLFEVFQRTGNCRLLAADGLVSGLPLVLLELSESNVFTSQFAQLRFGLPDGVLEVVPGDLADLLPRGDPVAFLDTHRDQTSGRRGPQERQSVIVEQKDAL